VNQDFAGNSDIKEGFPGQLVSRTSKLLLAFASSHFLFQVL
jgi:hypothetical protein